MQIIYHNLYVLIQQCSLERWLFNFSHLSILGYLWETIISKKSLLQQILISLWLWFHYRYKHQLLWLQVSKQLIKCQQMGIQIQWVLKKINRKWYWIFKPIDGGINGCYFLCSCSLSNPTSLYVSIIMVQSSLCKSKRSIWRSIIFGNGNGEFFAFFQCNNPYCM